MLDEKDIDRKAIYADIAILAFRDNNIDTLSKMEFYGLVCSVRQKILDFSFFEKIYNELK